MAFSGFIILLILGSICTSIYSQTFYNYIIFRGKWEKFKLEHNKSYNSQEEDYYRMNIFINNLKTISKHNELYKMGLQTYTKAINHFADLTEEEFKRDYLINVDSKMAKKPQENENINYFNYRSTGKPLPLAVDWRLLGAVTSVKYQGTCGSCYAFSAIGALEAQHYLATKNLTSLSVQNILDCTFMKRKYFNRGCIGGRMDYTYRYIIENKGIDTEQSYPYKKSVNKKCLFNETTIGATMKKFVQVAPGNENDLQAALALIGPVSVMMNAEKLQFYSGGIFNDKNCSQKSTHGMLVVGYGKYKSLDYWLLKNSWGIEWGEDGFLLLARNKGNMCGIATNAIYPIVD